ncbi:uncharacterized protein LOC663436 isoform X2 [Tribolium castaneum]|uniref:Uncharacterized protein n=1 Tax=Tribolium castaneum TaxID=7070 RepID=D2A2N6_TRICA|nr:PREDICTED: uncharacterized protein LOC663436 isoform X2 [Tribolium castaneum]EFA02750.1 hypothetical protein TcasGA2_TC008483 [Tribolium castaneum]|eukprot:XP_976452.1 PREDICTED: uncharacterized protein LOC663436 isoform X2 [Tribolium castaneum]
MECVKTCFLIFVLLTFVELYQCGRYGGSRGGGFGRGSSSRGTYHSPSPSYHVPSPSYHAPSYHSPSYSPSYRPTSRPYPPAYATPRYRPTHGPSPPPYRAPSTSRPYQASTRRPMSPASTPRPYFGGGVTTRRSQYSTPRPYFGGATTRRPYYQTTPRTVGGSGWNLPPRPGQGPIGPPKYGYSQGSGPQKIKIVNKYNYHYPGYYHIPVQQYGYPGYFYTPSYYHYSSHDTGSTALGFFLGYSLGKLTTPTFSHHSFYDGYTPRYDHYTVHHYYHNRDAIPQSQEIRANTIVGCVGDSVTICPVNTVSLCTSNGALMCVASATSTVPCTDNRQINCVRSVVPCVNSTAPECKNSNQNTTTINIPCISKAELYGDLKTINNTIIPANATLLNTTAVNNSTGTNEVSTQYPITTTPVPHLRKRDVAQNYCVTIVALPAKRQPTEGEQFLSDAKFLTGKFFESAWNL